MSIAQRLVTAGLSAVQAQAILGTVAAAVAAAGTTQGNATPLQADVNYVTTVAASTGVVAPPMNPSDEIVVYNKGGNPLLLYPPSGAVINGLGANAGYSIATATPYAVLTCISPLVYIAKQSA